MKEKTQLSDKSILCYVGAVRTFLSKNPDIDSLEDYNNFLMHMLIKKHGNMYYSAIKKFMQFKITDSNAREQLFSELIKPQMKDHLTARAYLTDEKRIEVINNLENEKHQVISLIQNLTGCRAGDIMKLKKGRLFFEEVDGENVIRLDLIGKRNKRINTHIFDKVAQNIIVYYIGQINEFLIEDYYFLEKSRGIRSGDYNNFQKLYGMNYMWYWRDLKHALERSGINPAEYATHDFRRCFARNIWDKYKDLQILQRALQHSDINTTMIYLNSSGLQNKDILKNYQSGK
jgi:site-specific recombinase XerD